MCVCLQRFSHKLLSYKCKYSYTRTNVLGIYIMRERVEEGELEEKRMSEKDRERIFVDDFLIYLIFSISPSLSFYFSVSVYLFLLTPSITLQISLSLYIYIHIYIHTHTHTHIYIYMYIYKYVCVCVCVCVYSFVCCSPK